MGSGGCEVGSERSARESVRRGVEGVRWGVSVVRV